MCHAESDDPPCTCPPHLHRGSSWPVWSPQEDSISDALGDFVAQHQQTESEMGGHHDVVVADTPPVKSASPPQQRSALANYGAITIAGLPVSSSNEHAMVVLHQAVGQAPQAASAHHKIEALRMFLENRLGLPTLIAAHRAMSVKGCGGTSDAEVYETVLSIVGFHNMDTVEVLDQLVQAERHTDEL